MRDALEPIIRGASAAAKIHESNSRLSGALGALCTACDAAYARLAHAPQAEVLAMRTALLGYTPSEDGTAERCLQSLLEPSAGGPSTVGVITSGAITAPSVDPPVVEPAVMEHPVRGVPLAAALRLPLWVTVPSFFGRRVEGTDWQLSRTVTRVDWFVTRPRITRSLQLRALQPATVCRLSLQPRTYGCRFVSHSWRDDGARKVAMLRELCFLQSFVARLIMVGLPLLTLLAPNPNPNPTPTPNSSPSPHPHPPRWACSSSSY